MKIKVWDTRKDVTNCDEIIEDIKQILLNPVIVSAQHGAYGVRPYVIIEGSEYDAQAIDGSTQYIRTKIVEE